ncbi:hypothetical protein Tco_0967103 [Tanacetum coccineum]
MSDRTLNSQLEGGSKTPEEPAEAPLGTCLLYKNLDRKTQLREIKAVEEIVVTDAVDWIFKLLSGVILPETCQVASGSSQLPSLLYLLSTNTRAAYYPDVGLEQMVPDQMWIEEECKYDIAAMYGISPLVVQKCTIGERSVEDLCYPKFLTHDDEARQEEVNEEDSFDPRFQTPSHVESTDDEDDNEEVQGVNIEGEAMDEAANNEKDKGNELYRDLNVNLEGRDVEMTDDQPTNVQITQVTEDTHVIITPVIPEGQQQSSSVSSGFISNMLNPRLDRIIDSIFNTEATSLVDVPVTTIAKPPLVFATTLPSPPTPLITHMQQTPFPIPTTAPSTSLQDLPNFGSLFGFDHRLKTLETNFSEFKQMNQFAAAVSSILDIVDAYLENKMNDAVKKVVQLQSDRLRDEAQAKNEDFLNKLDDNIKKIIKEQFKEQDMAQVSNILPKIEKTINEQLKVEVMTRSSTESKTSLAIAANLSELELKKILIDKMESNKRKDDEDKDEEPFAGSNRGSKRRRAGKEPESTSAPNEKTSKTTDGSKSQHKSAGESAHIEEPMHTDKDLEEPTHQDNLAREKGPRKSFDELMDTTLDFSAFMMNRLKIDTLTPELLAGLTFEMKGTCKILVELEYFFEEVYKASTDRLDWHNPEGQQFPHDLRKPLPLIPNSRGRQVILFDHFINNDLAYLSGGVSSRTYATSVTKTQAADYGHIKWIEDLVPNTMWSEVPNHCCHKASIVEWHGYTNLDWITVRKDDDKLYTFKEGDFKRLRLQDIKDMLILLDAYTAYSIPRGFIYLNKDKKNRLMRIDELHKFSDGTLDDVRTALNDRLKGIRMEYLPKTIWRQSDRERAKAMIQAIEKMLKSRRIMRSLERFVGGRPYGGDLRLLQRTI